MGYSYNKEPQIKHFQTPCGMLGTLLSRVMWKNEYLLSICGHEILCTHAVKINHCITVVQSQNTVNMKVTIFQEKQKNALCAVSLIGCTLKTQI